MVEEPQHGERMSTDEDSTRIVQTTKVVTASGKLPWRCRRGRHTWRLTTLHGYKGEVDAYESSDCKRCESEQHVTWNTHELADAEFQKLIDEEKALTAAFIHMMDNCEPTYAAGRGTKDGKIIDE